MYGISLIAKPTGSAPLSTTHMSPIPVNLDDLSRDPVDGCYHCPDCDAPFTRRSNLRRHFVIHTRDMPYRCTVCNQPFSRSEEFHYHSLQCTDQNWDGSMLQALWNTTLNSNSPGDPNDSQLSPSFFGPDTVPSSPSASSSSSTHEVDQAFLDFMSSIAPPSTPTAPQPQPHEPMYRNMRPGTSSPNNATFLPAVSPIAGTSNEAQARLQLRRRSRPYDTARRKGKGNPVYTRRQVDDMLDAVSTCFMSTIEKVARCAGTTAQPPAADGLRPVAFPHQPNLGFQEALLQEPLPCLVNGP